MLAMQVTLLLLVINGYQLEKIKVEFRKVVMEIEKITNSSCYSPEYWASNDYINYLATAMVNGSKGIDLPSPIEVYLQTQGAAYTQTLLCILNWSDNRLDGECQMFPTVMSPGRLRLVVLVNIIARRALNNVRIVGIQRNKNMTYTKYLTDVVRVHPEPEVSLKIDGRELSIVGCTYDISTNEYILVEFCVKFLKNPNISLSLDDEPMPSVAKDCVSRKFSTKPESFKVHVTYKDECCQFGSVTCFIRNTNKQLNVTETSKTSYWTITLSLAIVGIIVLAYDVAIVNTINGSGYSVYQKNENEKEKAKKLKMVKKSDPKVKKDPRFAGVIFEVYTTTPEDPDEESDSTDSS